MDCDVCVCRAVVLLTCCAARRRRTSHGVRFRFAPSNMDFRLIVSKQAKRTKRKTTLRTWKPGVTVHCGNSCISPSRE